MLAYASGNFGKALVFSGADLTILFLLTDVLKLPGTLAAGLMLFAVGGDLVFDLLAARLVIRWRAAGRGYRWAVTFAAIPSAAAFALIYAMPALGLHRAWMLAAAILIFRGAYALVDVPHNAMMAQVTSDSRARGRVSGYRLLFSTASALTIAAVLTPLVQQAGRAHHFGALALTGIGAGLAFALTMLLCAWASAGRRTDAAPRPCTGDGIAVPLRDPMVLGMGALALLTGFAMPCFGRMLIYLGSYVVDRPGAVTMLLGAMTCGQFAGVLGWTALTHRHSKSRLLAAGHAVSAFGMLLFAMTIAWPPGQLAAAALIGFGFASVFMLPWGLLADAVDVVQWRHDRRFETGLFAFYLVLVKASGAAATATIGWALAALGYVPGAVQPLAVRLGMLGLGLGVPLAGALLAMLLLRRFTLDHDRHARLLRALDWRACRQAGAEPVSGSKRGLEKSSGDGVTLAGGTALSAQARQSMSRSIAAPAAVRS
ncbi:MFS transporter [Sphingomonas sp. TDK1]|uniref:MFS transporter n=1 Tax=Sphingomonas sp. TDK1 TaxID=453247 RepID=UPI0007D9C359|nr:MFS transporter [Sphingomonas sp. TDK1]OAN62193.1 sugar:proton symporter [Sphingomonas sp. TDK1]